MLALALEFAQTVDGALMAKTGCCVMVTFALELPVQPDAVRLMPRVTLPEAPAVKTMFGVPCPLSIVPLLMLQT